MEYHSVHSAPDSRMNRMEGIRFTRNRRNRHSFGKFLAVNPTRPLARADSSFKVTSAMGIPFPDFRSVLFEVAKTNFENIYWYRRSLSSVFVPLNLHSCLVCVARDEEPVSAGIIHSCFLGSTVLA